MHVVVVDRIPRRVLALPGTGLQPYGVVQAEVVVVHQQQGAVGADRVGQPLQQRGDRELLALGRVEPLDPVRGDHQVEPRRPGRA